MRPDANMRRMREDAAGGEVAMAKEKTRTRLEDFGECACSGRSLVRLVRPAVLSLLAGAPLHGYRLLQRMRALAMFRDQAPDATGLYRLLKTMEDEGLIAASWDAGQAGPARRRYELTPRGRSCLAQWNRTLVRYLRSVAELLDLTACNLHGWQQEDPG